MRKVTKSEMLREYENAMLSEILVLSDRILARKNAEAIYCDYP